MPENKKASGLTLAMPESQGRMKEEGYADVFFITQFFHTVSLNR